MKSAAATALLGSSELFHSKSTGSPSAFLNIHRSPDVVRAFNAKYEEVLLERSVDRWAGGGAEILVQTHQDHVSISQTGTGISRIQLRWHGDLSRVQLFLGDHWERSYGDLQWQSDSPNRIMPWYFLAKDEKATHGYGVRTGAGSFCFWTADSQGISLWADVRSGGVPVELKGRTLKVAEVICGEGAGENSFTAARHFCKLLCSNPRLAAKPIYGTNDWNYAYGNNSADLIARVSSLVSELSEDRDNRPYSVIDEGWAMGSFAGKFGHGPWEGNPKFGEMSTFADRLKGLGVKPGLWFRPLTRLPNNPDSWILPTGNEYLDPTIPEVREQIGTEVRKFASWGYELIKHDFTTWDFLGLWGFEMGPSPTKDGWKPHDTSRTNAEILTGLYQTIREAAGDLTLIGCNTVGHLAAGTHELQRIGDDTSGRSWDRNRRMGVNTLAFRAVQHRAFFDVDPDIVAITKEIEWPLVEQWLSLVSESGTTLFVAADPDLVDSKHRAALKQAFSIAAKRQVIGEPLNWTESVCPTHWRLLGREKAFAWMGNAGAWPYTD